MGTSLKSSWPMARMVQLSMIAYQPPGTSLLMCTYITQLTNAGDKAHDTQSRHSIADQVWLASTVERSGGSVVLVVVGRLW